MNTTVIFIYEKNQYINMRASLICYSLIKTKPVTRTNLQRELYGYKDISNHGKYVYERKGIIQTTNSKRIIDSVILTEQKNTNSIIKLLKKYKAKTYVFIVIIRNKI